MKLIIEELIKDSGMKKRFIADKIGVNENTLNNWCKNRSVPKLDQAVQLAEILNCKTDDLYTRKP